MGKPIVSKELDLSPLLYHPFSGLRYAAPTILDILLKSGDAYLSLAVNWMVPIFILEHRLPGSRWPL